MCNSSVSSDLLSSFTISLYKLCWKCNNPAFECRTQFPVDNTKCEKWPTDCRCGLWVSTDFLINGEMGPKSARKWEKMLKGRWLMSAMCTMLHKPIMCFNLTFSIKIQDLSGEGKKQTIHLHDLWIDFCKNTHSPAETRFSLHSAFPRLVHSRSPTATPQAACELFCSVK